MRLPICFAPAGRYVHAVRTGNLLALAGHVPIDPDGHLVIGKLGRELDVAAGRNAARLAALTAIATLREHVRSDERVHRVVSLRGYVNATAEFVEHTQVIDAASEVFITLFGEAGQHARIAFGVTSLPANLAVEIELLIEINGQGGPLEHM
jgi:enamine deaminase RidA (YjgF/YER057c/UK114 family)